MKFWNTNICLTSPTSIMIIISLFLCVTVLANVWPKEVIIEEVKVDEEKPWIPTKEDIAYQDSMYSIIQNTQNDITDIKEDIVYILERLDYEDGTWDSIRYVKGGKFINAKFSSSSEMCKDILKKTGVALLPGSDFGLDSKLMIARLSYTDFDGEIFLKNTSGSKNLDTEDIKKYAPNIVDGISKLKGWSNAL